MGENGPRFRLINLWETETDRQQLVLLAHRPRARKPEPFAQPQYGLEPPDRTSCRVEGLKAADPRHRSLDTVEQKRARYRGYLLAAFGADFDLALSGGEGGPD
jgi:hypothetical protein